MTPSLKRWLPAATFTALGAALMYFFDPGRGKRRRAVTRDRTAGMTRRFARRTGQRARYVEGKAHGLVHEMRGEAPKPSRNDATLKHKIESEVLRNYDNSRLSINVEDGVAVLRGELTHPEEIKDLEKDVERVPGVVGVQNLVRMPGG